MALGKRVSQPKSIVLNIDPSIDQEKSDYGKYLESSFDESHLAFIENEEPTRFTIKQLTSNQKDFLSGLTNNRDKAKWSVRFALVGIQNYFIERDGSLIPFAGLDFSISDAGKLGKVIDDKCFESLDFNTDVLVALWVAIDTFSEASPF